MLPGGPSGNEGERIWKVLAVSACLLALSGSVLVGARSIYIHWAQEMFDQAGMVRELVKWDYELRNLDQRVGRFLLGCQEGRRGERRDLGQGNAGRRGIRTGLDFGCKQRPHRCLAEEVTAYGPP